LIRSGALGFSFEEDGTAAEPEAKEPTSDVDDGFSDMFGEPEPDDESQGTEQDASAVAEVSDDDLPDDEFVVADDVAGEGDAEELEPSASDAASGNVEGDEDESILPDLFAPTPAAAAELESTVLEDSVEEDTDDSVEVSDADLDGGVEALTDEDLLAAVLGGRDC